MTSETFQETPEPWWSSHNTIWFLAVAIGVLLFELTAQPSLVVVAVCTKLGLNDFLNALWLRRQDSLRYRGKICGWFCVSHGMWKITLCALAIMMVLGSLAAPARAEILAGAMVFLLSFVLASFTTWIGVSLARIAGLRVWIDGRMTQSRRSGIFPPEPGETNRARWLVIGSFIMPLIIMIVILAVVMDMGGQAQGANAVHRVMALLVTVFVIPIGGLLLGIHIARVVLAPTWEECWARVSRRAQRLQAESESSEEPEEW